VAAYLVLAVLMWSDIVSTKLQEPQAQGQDNKVPQELRGLFGKAEPTNNFSEPPNIGATMGAQDRRNRLDTVLHQLEQDARLQHLEYGPHRHGKQYSLPR